MNVSDQLIHSFANDLHAFQQMLNGPLGERNFGSITSAITDLWKDVEMLDRRAVTTHEAGTFQAAVEEAVTAKRRAGK